MTDTADAPAPAAPLTSSAGAPAQAAPTVDIRLERAAGVELLGPVQGSGYRQGAALARRADGQMVQMGPLMYAALEAMDGQRDRHGVAEAMSAGLGRSVGAEHVDRLAEKLAREGLLVGSEHLAPPRRNPLLSLRWKVLVTGEKSTRRLTAPFTFLFRWFLMVPVVLAFGWVFWFVLIDKGVAGATSQAFKDPALLLLVFGLTVVSAGFHELGHAAACRYGGAQPGGMGAGLYLVWPAFYTDVTDAYRLPRRARLRVDLAGLYFNAVVAVATMGVWLFWRVDALLLLVALQVLQMVKQLSPVIRADGYHILSDATGVPDLYSHMGPTMRRLLPGHRHEAAALRGWPRVLVTLWVLIVVPVLLSLMASAVILLPRLATSAWDSGRHLIDALPADASKGRVIDVLAVVLQLLALILPVVGSVLITQKVLRMTVSKARAWSAGRPIRRLVVLVVAGAIAAGLAWAWWPSGQYKPVRAGEKATIGGLVRLVSNPVSAARPAAPAPLLTPGTHLAVAMVPVGGASATHPAYLFLPGSGKKPPVAVVDTGSSVTAFPFQLPGPPGPGDNQAESVNTQNGGVVYDVAYSLVVVSGGAPVTQTNGAYAIASCNGCTTAAVAFQVVLVVGQSDDIAPVNAAEAVNYKCPACSTTAIADQIVVTLSQQPSAQLIAELEASLEKLGAIPQLGANGTPAAIASEVAAVQQQIDTELQDAGVVANNTTTSGSSGGSTSATSTTTLAPTTATTGSGSTPATTSPTTTAGSSSDTTATTSPPTTDDSSTDGSTATTSPPTTAASSG